MTMDINNRLIFTRDSSTQEHPHAKEELLNQYLVELEKQFTVSTETLKEITGHFIGELERGLEKPNQVVPMYPTYVFGWPQGNETGDYLALDMGGTNIRVCLVTVKGNGEFELTQTKYRISNEQKREDGEKLFDFFAESIRHFIEHQYGSIDKVPGTLSLGFTFSFPTEQNAIDQGVLRQWTKGFANPNTEGHDCAEMLRQALKRKNVPVQLNSIINDTTGTLIASNYVRNDTRIACIFGTGCNAAYMEDIKSIPKIKDLDLPPNEQMVINCEYGAFDSDEHKFMKSARTKYDEIIDRDSTKPDKQTFEKMISGLYLGELFRLVICELVYNGVLFLGQETYKIEKKGVFDTAFLSLIETDPTDELLTVVGLFKYFFSLETDIEERRFFKKLAQLIGTRSARLSACGIASITRKKGLLETMPSFTVGVDGSLFSKYPHFPDRLKEALVDILGPKAKNINLQQAEDGSGAGSAVIAAMTKARKEAGVHEEL